MRSTSEPMLFARRCIEGLPLQARGVGPPSSSSAPNAGPGRFPGRRSALGTLRLVRPDVPRYPRTFTAVNDAFPTRPIDGVSALTDALQEQPRGDSTYATQEDPAAGPHPGRRPARRAGVRGSQAEVPLPGRDLRRRGEQRRPPGELAEPGSG